MHLLANNDIYEDEQGQQEGDIQKRKIFEIEPVSVDAQIKIISGIIAIMKQKDPTAREKLVQLNTFISNLIMKI